MGNTLLIGVLFKFYRFVFSTAIGPDIINFPLCDILRNVSLGLYNLGYI